MLFLILFLPLISISEISSADSYIWEPNAIIRSDGSIDPVNAPIKRFGDLYVFTGDLIGSLHVERSNILIYGAGFTIIGNGRYAIGIWLSGVNNITIKDTKINNFNQGITIEYGSDNNIIGCNITNNELWGIGLRKKCHYNTISRNYIATNNLSGIDIYGESNFNIASQNIIEFNRWAGIAIYSSFNNTISENYITKNIDEGILISAFAISENNIVKNNTIEENAIGLEISTVGGGNLIYNNDFLSNTIQVRLRVESQYSDEMPIANMWDNGSNLGGNFWSDYKGKDSDGNGIGDTSYVIDENNQDRYPLGSFNNSDYTHLFDNFSDGEKVMLVVMAGLLILSTILVVWKYVLKSVNKEQASADELNPN